MELKEIADTLGTIKRTFEEFKAHNDQLLKGKADVVLVEKVDRINAALTEAQTKYAAQVEAYEKRSTESTATIAELRAAIERAVKTGREDHAPELVKAARSFYVAKYARHNLRDDEIDMKAFGAYEAAFSKFVQRGLLESQLTPDEQRALSVGQDTSGGFLVRPVMADSITKKIFESTPMRAIANVISITSDAWETLQDTDEATSGGWVAERASRATTGTPAIGTLRIPVHEQYAFPEITQKVLDDAAIDVESWLADKVADIMGRTETTAFVTGTGLNKPRGFLDYASAALTTDDATRAWGVLQYVVTGAAGDFPALSGIGKSADPLITLVYKLNPAYRANARFLMARGSVAAVRKLKDDNGQYYWQPALQAGQPSTLLQYPVTEGEDMTAIAADSYSIAFGDFRQGYTIVDRMGYRILRDPYTNKPYIGYYTTKRVGGDVVNFDAIKLLKFSA